LEAVPFLVFQIISKASEIGCCIAVLPECNEQRASAIHPNRLASNHHYFVLRTLAWNTTFGGPNVLFIKVTPRSYRAYQLVRFAQLHGRVYTTILGILIVFIVPFWDIFGVP
jgi:hypothetical protein